MSLVTLTLSRYILESSLLDYRFVGHRESLMAAACLLLAMCMNSDGVWVCLQRNYYLLFNVYYYNFCLCGLLFQTKARLGRVPNEEFLWHAMGSLLQERAQME